MDEETRRPYLAFILTAPVFILAAAYVDLILFGFLPIGQFYPLYPKIILVLLVAVAVSCHRIRFNIPVVFALAIMAVLVTPSLFLVLSEVFTGHMNIDFFKTMVGK